MRWLAKKKMLMLTCQQASRLLSQQEDAPLPLGKRMRLRLHLAFCDACRNVSRQFAAIRLALENWRGRN